LTTLADLQSKTGDPAGALNEYRQANAILEKLSAAAPGNLFTRGALAESLVATGSLLARLGRVGEARTLTTRGMAIARELASLPAATPDELNRYAQILLTCQPAELRDSARALRIAEQAVAKSGGHDPRSLHVLEEARRQLASVSGSLRQ